MPAPIAVDTVLLLKFCHPKIRDSGIRDLENQDLELSAPLFWPILAGRYKRGNCSEGI
jgi:hypothetical protein